MKRGAWLAGGLLMLATTGWGQGDFLDRLDEHLTVSSESGAVRARLSGTLDVEAYSFQQPAPGLVVATGTALFNPRLTAFLDVQLGPRAYLFLQGRLDRGFDPSDGGTEGRLDEYALRVTPWEDGRLNFQVGKFATVVGNWVRRHGTWDNPFITAPLPYENLTGMWDVAAVRSTATLLRWSHVRPKTFAGEQFADSRFRLPIIWGPSYAAGASVAGELGSWTYAAEVKNGSLSSRPEYWEVNEVHWNHPTFSGRIGYRPDERWDVGVSASAGSYLLPSAAPTVAAGHDLDDYRELVLAQDVSFAWHHWQLWAEVFVARYTIPLVGDAQTTSWYAEAKYKVTPQFFAAVRWNQQVFGDVTDNTGDPVRWGYNTWRLDFAPTYRLTAHAQLKLQYSVQPDDLGGRVYQHTLAGQFTIRF